MLTSPNPVFRGIAALSVVLVAIAAGYRAGTGSWPVIGHEALQQAEPAAVSGEPMDHSAMDHSQMDHSKMDHSAPASSANKPGKKLLYYRNPMGLADTSPVPKKDWMGMDYIPVYEGEEEEKGSSTFKVSLDKVQRAGVRSEEVRRAGIVRHVRAPGIAKPDERTLRTISLRADGFIEKLYANEHGLHVAAGQPLFRVYSQEMLRALVDYRLETKEAGGAGRAFLTAGQKLINFEVPRQAIEEARTAKEVPMAFDWPSPVSGVIMEKKAIEGQMARMGEPLFLIGDLSTIWVIADIAEQDIGDVQIGAPATLAFRAIPGETFEGKVTFILHELDHAVRTAKARIEVKNPGHKIRHEMYADVEIASGEGGPARLAVPATAVIDSGTRQVVLVERGEGRFDPRPVKTGLRGGGLVEILDGVKEGERVVVSANFLIDAESNLRAALAAFTADHIPAVNQERPQ